MVKKMIFGARITHLPSCAMESRRAKVVGHMEGFGRNENAPCEQRMPASNLSGCWFIDASMQVIESHIKAPTKIKATGNVASEIPKIKALDIAPLNLAIEVVAPGSPCQCHRLGLAGRTERHASLERKCCKSPKAKLLVTTSSFAVPTKIHTAGGTL
jgi:hypothetical protein